MFVAKIFRETLESIKPEQVGTVIKKSHETLCRTILAWSQLKKISFLELKAKLKLGEVLSALSQLREANDYVSKVIKEAREMDDKHLLVESHLLETKIQFKMNNIPRAKSALTACRANSNSVFCSSLLIAEIETTAGMIHIWENDYKISFSYFYEAFEMFHQNKKPERALQNFQYILLCKIMADSADEASNLLNGRFGIIYGQKGFSPVMALILEAYKNKDLVALQKIRSEHRPAIQQDQIISNQIRSLYTALLEKNIIKLTKPYTRVQLAYLSAKLGVSVRDLDQKISEMILDGKMNGTLDQGQGNLILFDSTENDPIYTHSAQVLDNMNLVLNSLFERSKKLA